MRGQHEGWTYRVIGGRQYRADATGRVEVEEAYQPHAYHKSALFFDPTYAYYGELQQLAKDALSLTLPVES